MGYEKGRKKGRHLKIFPKDYTVVDLETTGWDCTHDYMIEVGAIKVRDNKVVDTFSELVKTKVYYVLDDEHVKEIFETGIVHVTHICKEHQKGERK